MNLEDKFLNSMGMPARIHSVRDAIKYFDDNPALAANTPVAQADASRREVPQFRHPPAGEMMSGDFRKAPMHYRGTFTDTTRFSNDHDVLPAERLKATGPRDKLSDNIAARMKRDLQLRLLEGSTGFEDGLMPEHVAAGFVGNADHESGEFGRLRGNLWQQGRDTGRDKGNALGAFQWDGVRRKDLQNWAAENGYDLQSIEQSYRPSFGFLEHELTDTSEKKVLKSLRPATNADEAARIIEGVYLRSGKPRLEERQRLARRAMSLPDYEPPVPTPRPSAAGTGTRRAVR
ncbi:phage tail tip lysozyme [Ensifer canadensis]